MTELPWMAEARRHLGLREIVGAKHNPIIQSWLKEMGNFPNAAKAWYAEDETPWCGLFVGYCLGKSGAPSSRIGIVQRHGLKQV